MKKPYTKPQLAVESFHLDAAVAASCTNTANGIALNHEIYGCTYDVYFAEGPCQVAVIGAEWDKKRNVGGDINDTLCYHGPLGIAVLAYFFVIWRLSGKPVFNRYRMHILRHWSNIWNSSHTVGTYMALFFH